MPQLLNHPMNRPIGNWQSSMGMLPPAYGLLVLMRNPMDRWIGL
jgi:hypothetical protein